VLEKGKVLALALLQDDFVDGLDGDGGSGGAEQLLERLDLRLKPASQGGERGE